MEKRFIMKKIIQLVVALTITCILILFSGCGIYTKIDLEKTKKEIATLKTTKIELSKVKEVLEQEEQLPLEDIEIDALEELHIDKEYIAYENKKPLLIFKQEKENEINTVPLTSYIIVKPSEDKKDLLAQQINDYYQKLLDEYSEKEDAKQETKERLENILKKEYEGYLIYILSDDNEKIWKRIEESSHSLLFEQAKELSLKDFIKQFSLEEKYIAKYQAVVPSKKQESSLYVIVRPKDGKTEAVKKRLDQYMKEYEKKWSTYLPQEYELIKNRMETEVGSYLVYIISRDNATVLNTIKSAVMKKDE